MVEIKIEIPEELKQDMAGLSELMFSLVATRLVKQEFERLARLKGIVAKSKLTEEDVEELSDKVNTALSKRYLGDA